MTLGSYILPSVRGWTCRDCDHTGVSAPSKGGKSHFARAIAQAFMSAGKRVLVCDPLGYQWPATWVTTDMSEFITTAKREKDCLLLIDESGLAIDRDKSLRWLFVTSRHNHHVTYALMQDYTQLIPEMRKQLTQLFLFACHPDEAEVWSRQFHRCADDITQHAPRLERYECLLIRQYAAPKRLKLPA